MNTDWKKDLSMNDAGRKMSSFLLDATDPLPAADLTEKIIGCAFKVANTLGPGFLEKVYENALAHEIRKPGLVAEQQKRVEVFYDGLNVGYLDADIVVEGTVTIEVKAVRALEDAHKAQTLNYLKATGLRLGLLINFGSARVEVKRVAL